MATHPGPVTDEAVDVSRLRDLLNAAGLTVDPLTEADAALAGALPVTVHLLR